MARLKEMELSIGGMHCASCTMLLDKTFENIEGVEEAEAILATNKLYLKINPKKISFEKIVETVDSIGFEIYFDEVTLKINGMHCGSCAMNTENFLNSLNGVFQAKVTLTTEDALIFYDKSKVSIADFERGIEKLGFEVVGIDGELNIDEKELFEKEQRLKLIRIFVGLLFAVIAIIVMRFNFVPYGFTLGQFLLILTIFPFIFVAYPILKAGIKGLSNKNLNMDVMYSMGILVAFISSLCGTFGILDSSFMFYETSLMLPAFLNIGRYLEANAKGKTSDSIKKLIGLQPTIATRINRSGKIVEIDVSKIEIGDILIVKPGDKIPVDGEVIEGSSYVDESMINGEPVPNLKELNSVVLAGTINQDSVLKIRALKVGKNTLLSNIIQMVEKAQTSKPPVQKIADTAVSYFIPVILTIAVIVFCMWYFLLNSTLIFALTTLVSILVVACPCALGLATPTAVTVGLGRASEFGILIKNGEALEKACDVDIAVFDKTGTITEGRPVLDDIYSYEITKEELLTVVGSLERNSTHPIARSIVEECKNRNIDFITVEEFENIPGKGIKAKVNSETVYAGNLSLIKDVRVSDDVLELYERLVNQNKTVIIAATSSKVLGILSLSDKIKENTSDIIDALKEMNIKTLMLTGDNEKTAGYVASEVGIDEYKSELLPGNKLTEVKSLQKDSTVLFVGDGINDAPSLTQADIGVAMGNGTDIAMESGDIVLVEGNLENVVAAIQFSKKVVSRIKLNLFWAFAYNVILIPCAAGILYPAFGIIFKPEWAALAMALSSVTVITLSLMLKTYTPPVKK